MKLRLRPEAHQELLDAAQWYESRDVGLGEVLVEEVEATLGRIERGPQRYKISYRDMQRALVRRFPYAVHFLAVDDEIVVMAILHQRRDVRVLDERLDDMN